MNNVVADGTEPSNIVSTAGQQSFAVSSTNSATGLKPFGAVQSVGMGSGYLAGLAAFTFAAYFA
jgi:hypothetical protein